MSPMNQAPAPLQALRSPEDVLRNYFHAKDENRPLLLDRVFVDDAVLEVRNRSDAIAFPAQTSGRDAIADVLVRTFNQTYENIFSFYLGRPAGELSRYACAWLVAMTEKSSRSVRVGCGNYEWTFAERPPRLAARLVIDLTTMVVHDSTTTAVVYDFVERLTYPWSSLSEVTAAAEGVAELGRVVESLLARPGHHRRAHPPDH